MHRVLHCDGRPNKSEMQESVVSFEQTGQTIPGCKDFLKMKEVSLTTKQKVVFIVAGIGKQKSISFNQKARNRIPDIELQFHFL